MATTDTDVQTALANEARLQGLRQKIANLKGAVDATAGVVQRLNSINSDSLIALQAAQAELTALETDAGPGITADFGPKSVITQLIETERFAAKDAAIDYVKANPACTEADAAQAWDTAALASHPDFTSVIQSGLVMSALYRANLLKAAMIPDDTWESHRAFILNTDKATLESL
jgi:TolA-binding protein